MTWSLHLGDCLEYVKSLPAGSVDAVVTDPPYGIGFARQPTKWSRDNLARQKKDWDDSAPCVRWLLPIAKTVVIWGGNHFDLPVSRGWMAWTKPKTLPSFGTVELAWSNVDRNIQHIHYSRSSMRNEMAGHPTQKPVEVMKWCMDVAKIPVGATVFDPYCGSGTTGVACIQTGRNFIGCEISPEYHAIATRRLQEAENNLFAGATK